MRRDFARNQLPQGSCWNLVDYIPNEGAPIRQRGGYQYASPDLSTVNAASAYVTSGIFAPFSGGAQNVCVDEDGRVYSFTSGAASDRSTVAGLGSQKQNPVFHADLVVFPSDDGTTGPAKWSGSGNIAALGGSPPAGQYATVFKDYTVLAATAANPRRLFFSEPGSPDTTWDTTGAIWDVSTPVKGLAALRNVILIFQAGTTARLRGSIPPPDGDMALDDPVYDIGLVDARSIALWKERCIWASTEGIFRTDGSTLEDLTRRGSMLTYWQDLMSSYSSSYIVAGGVIRDSYILSVNDGTTFKDAFLIDLNTGSWFRVANLDAHAFWAATGAVSDELYFGRRGAPRVASVSSFWNPASAVKADADGDSVLPVLETPFYEGQPGLKSWKRVYVSYQLTDYGSDNPSITVSYVKTPEATSYTALSPTLAETTTFERSRLGLGFDAHGVGLKLARTGAGDTLGYALEAEFHPREQSRLAA